MIELLRRDPHVAYYSNVLSLPKSHVSEMQLRGALTYELNGKKGVYEAWARERDHYLVPRNYIAATSFSRLPFPVIDARLKRFPRVRFQSKVILDARNPGEAYQREGVSALLNTNNGVLCLRCGAGKSVCGIHAISLTQTPGLIIVNDLGLAQQWHDEIRSFTDLKDGDIGFIGDGEFRWKHKLTIGLVHTLARQVSKGTLPRELVEWFGVVLADEAHTTAGPAHFGLAMSAFHGRRWGLSATPRRSDNFDSLLRYTMGPVVYSYLMPELTPLIYFRRLPTKLNLKDHAVARAVCDISKELHLQKLYGYLATRDDRVGTIASEIRVALKQGRHVLVLSQSRAMVERLGDLFPDAGVIHGGVKRKERAERVNRNPLIAIASLGRQALNKPILDTLLVCEPFSDAGVLQQLIGRIQRPHPDKQRAMAVFYDDVHIADIHNICMKMRTLLSRWPDNQGGRMHWQNIGTV